MRFTSGCLSTFVVCALTFSPFNAFSPTRFTLGGHQRQHHGLLASQSGSEFDYLLGEYASNEIPSQFQQTPTRRRISLNDDSRTVLVSSFPGATTADQYTEAGEADGETIDPYGEEGLTPQMQRYQQTVKESVSFPKNIENKIKSMDLNDIMATLIIPAVIVGAGVRWGVRKAAGRASDTVDATLDDFANEMIYHDGDFEEMRLCVNDYSKKLLFLGPKKTSAMLKRYLELYAKKKTVSPQAISSLSTVFSLFKLSEEKAAALLVSLCRDMGPNKIASSGKILFFGSRILKSPEAKAALEPIKEMIKATYREGPVAETLVEASQQAMAEAAYRSAVQSGGANQKSLTIGWEVLGLDKETATTIFEEEAKEGFKTMRERMYGGQTTKYDKRGNKLDDEGNVADPENAIGADEPEEPVSGVYECGECGYTLFIAKGRESKFFGEGFTCPECGAPKDKFNARDMEEE